MGGFVLYVVALALAPLSLVQATAAGGIGILAIMVSRITHVALTRREKVGAAVSVLGLALLGVSLSLQPTAREAERRTSGSRSGSEPRRPARSCASRCSRARSGAHRHGASPPGSSLPPGTWRPRWPSPAGSQNVAFLVCLIVFYGAGTAVLQAAFQRGGALTTAGLSTLLTNALPIAAGMVLFHEPLPSGLVGAVRVAAFAAVIAGAVLLAARDKEAEPHPSEQELTRFKPIVELSFGSGVLTRP